MSEIKEYQCDKCKNRLDKNEFHEPLDYSEYLIGSHNIKIQATKSTLTKFQLCKYCMITLLEYTLIQLRS